MTKRLYGQLVLVLAGLTIAYCGAFLVFVVLCLNIYEQELTQRLNRNLARSLLSDYVGAARELRADDLRRMFGRHMMLNPAIEIYLLDRTGLVLATAVEPGNLKRRQIDPAPIEAFLTEPDSLPIYGDDPSDFKRRKIFSAASLDGAQGGYLYVLLAGMAEERLASALRGSYVARAGSWIFLGFALVLTAAALIVFALLTRRVTRLTWAIDAFERDGFKREGGAPPAPGNEHGDEIDRLGAAFNRIARQMREHMATLKKSDELRRELMTNISHDLRTPLAALRGYLETLLMKGEDIPPQERRNYVGIAVRQSEHLTKLVSNLFELAKLDAEQVQIHKEPVMLGELVQDVAQKFTLAAEKREIQLTVELSEQQRFVDGDIGLLERVFENLLENALRFTPERGVIKLAVNARPDGVSVSVSDNGSGIPEAELPFVFNRFYKAGNAHRAHDHAGIGLAVVKRVIELHGGEIRVRSREGEGTTFTFDLAAANP